MNDNQHKAEKIEIKPSTEDENQGAIEFEKDKPFERIEKKFTPIKNTVFDFIMPYCNRHNKCAFSVLMAIFRKTRGWNKTEDRISYSQIMEATGLAKATVWKALRFLEGEPDPKKKDGIQPKYKLINVRREAKFIYYSLNASIEIETRPKLTIKRINFQDKNGSRCEPLSNNGSRCEPLTVQDVNTQNKRNKDKTCSESDLTSFIHGILKIYNKTFHKRARRSKALEKAAADLIENSVTLKHYAEGCKRYQAKGTRSIKGPASIAPWAVNVMRDELQGVTKNQSQVVLGGANKGYFDADNNWHEDN